MVKEEESNSNYRRYIPSNGESLRGVSCLIGGGVTIDGMSLMSFFARISSVGGVFCEGDTFWRGDRGGGAASLGEERGGTC